MKRYQIEASTFELNGTESHTVLYTSNGISTARAYLEGFTTASDWKDYDLINLLDTAHPNDSDCLISTIQKNDRLFPPLLMLFNQYPTAAVSVPR